jgi:hypothetical protein
MEKYQLKIEEDKNFSPAGGALLIPAFFEKFGLRELINKNIALCSGKHTKKFGSTPIFVEK